MERKILMSRFRTIQFSLNNEVLQWEACQQRPASDWKEMSSAVVVQDGFEAELFCRF